MREFMEYVHSAFYEATGWRRSNSYAALNSTPDALLNFKTAQGLRLTLSALASPNFATSYQLGSVGVVDGSISYLFSSVPLRVLLTPRSENVPLPTLLRSYRPLSPLTRRDDPSLQSPEDKDKPNSSLLYGRLYLPQSQLEALLVRRISPALQVQFSAVSGQHLRNGGTALGLAQYDVGRYALEGLASSDGGLLGFRGVYNSGGDVSKIAPSPAPTAENHGNGDKERIYGRFSTGGEVYYGTLNKSGGMSIGTRFATLPDHRGTPLSATLTLNPLMGNIAASYAVMAGKYCSLATRMEFNVFSYESAWAVGMELWRKPFARPVKEAAPPRADASVEKKKSTSGVQTAARTERSFQAKLEWRLDGPETESRAVAEMASAENAVKPEKARMAKGQKGGVDNVLAEKPKMDEGRRRGGQTASVKAPAKPEKTKTKTREEDQGRTGVVVETASAKDPRKQEQEQEREEEQKEEQEEYAGVLKVRLDQNLRIGVLWEGRVKSLLFSLGSGIDLRKTDKPFRTLGLEIQFSS